MKRILAVSAGLVSLILLGACGLLPPIPINDPLGLHNAELAVTVAVNPTSMSALAVTDAGGTTTPIPFKDLNLSLPLNPRSLTVYGGLQSAVTVALPEGAVCPETLTISNITLTVKLWDGATTYDGAIEARRVSVPASDPRSFTMSRDSETSCSYTFGRTDLLVGSLQVELSGDKLSRAIGIIQSAPGDNYVEATITMTVSGTPIHPSPGTVITFRLDMARGEVRVF